MRPISSNIPIDPSLVGRPDMTASRPAGVGRPTIPQRSDAQADVPEPPAPLPVSRLIQEAVDTALDSIEVLEAQARDAARRFRRPSIEDAQTRLAELVESTRTLIDLAVMAAQASGTSLETLSAAHGGNAERQTQTALLALIGRQIERDWHGLARTLEQPFVAALAAWRRIFLALDGSSGPLGTAA